MGDRVQQRHRGRQPTHHLRGPARLDRGQPGSIHLSAPPNHVGMGFVRQLFYWAAGSPEPFLGEFDQAVYDEYAPIVWEYLNGIEPYLWREGQTYPELAAMANLLANQEIDFAMEYDSSRASTYIRQGIYPDTIRTLVFDTGTIANVSYVAIPYNAANPAGALVLANFLLSPEYQIAITDPEVLGWKMAIDPTRLTADEQTQLAAIEQGIATLPADVLSAAALPESSVGWVDAMETGWEENVLKN
ncbi:MAG: ABC transporter substrate-binding protein [Caldilineaceae bacterium]